MPHRRRQAGMAVTASLCKNLLEYMNTLNSVTEVPGDNYESRVLDSGKGFRHVYTALGYTTSPNT